jgi:cysteine desulfurase
MLYFDHCASTPPYDEVIDTVSEVMKRYYGNPSSIHRMGLEAERLLMRSREVIASSLHIDKEQIIYTSGGTESNNLAIKGSALQYRKRGNHLITTKIEHSSVYESFQQLEKMGFRVTYLPVDHTGKVQIEDVRNAICEETILVSIMHVNNETGTIQPIKEVGQLLIKYPRILFHVDAVQSMGKIQMDPAGWGIDMMSLSAHKLRGPKGTGLLYCRSGIELTPLIVGGGQERGLRSGTENVPLIVGMSKAIRLTVEHLEKNRKHLYQLREKLVYSIGQIPEIVINGSLQTGDMAPHIVNFSFPGMKSEVAVHALEGHGIIASTRSACSSGEQRPSRILEAMGYDRERASSGIRISLSPEHTVEDIDELCNGIQLVVSELKHTRKTRGNQR